MGLRNGFMQFSALTGIHHVIIRSMIEAKSSDTDSSIFAYSPSWLDRFVIWLKRLPGPVWIPYLALAIVGMGVSHLPVWTRGDVTVGSLQLDGVYWGLLPTASLLLATYVRRLTADSFDRFRPALTLPKAEAQAVRYRLVFLPAWPAFAITIGAIVLTGLSLAFDPEGSGIVDTPWLGVTGVALIQSFVGSILFLLLYRLIRQIGIVRGTLANAVIIDVFRPGPLQAFANLAARPGALLTLLVASSTLIQPLPADFYAFMIGWAPYLFLPPIVAAIAFVAPLTGLHRQLSEQKAALEDAATIRLKATLSEFNRDVDAGELTRIKKINAALQGLMVQRDLLASLKTWPWSTTTLRSFVSTIALPLAVFLVQQAASEIL